MKQLLPIYVLAGISLIGAFVLAAMEKGPLLVASAGSTGIGVVTWAMKRESDRRAQSEHRAKKAEDELFSQTGTRLPKE